MTHLDLFTGIGGFHLAAGWAGFQTVGFSEIEPYCCQLLAEKWPDIHNYGDIRTADFSGLRGSITVLSAGVPCQPASLAGKRRGEADDRWLWPATLDVVGTVQPAWCLFENPPGIVSLDEFKTVLLCLATLGYETERFGVPANAVGADHLRYRTFIVANAEERGIRCGETQRQSGQPPLAGERAEALADTDRRKPSRESDSGRLGSEQCEAQTETQGSGKSTGYERTWVRVNPGTGGETLADTDDPRLQGWDSRELCERVGQRVVGTSGSRRFPRLTQPPLCRRADGIQNRSHRLKALGNAIVPQQSYPFFAAIAQVERGL